ncbi:MAG: hydroxyethylthiazole kinase [Rhizobiales bacterium]|nr:hydroxyethylthiazole kinase [Hyphomicrobiales bacterium]
MTESLLSEFSALQALRARRPLVQNITNYVAMTISANVLLALGASPAMVHAAEEVEEFVAISDALVVNIGTLSPAWVTAMRRAVARAAALGKPWVLDPVGCGATPYRTDVATELAGMRPTIVRANASEVLSLAGVAGAAAKGVDSTTRSDDAVAAAMALAHRIGTVVAVTGATDYVTDGSCLVTIESGHALMSWSTALGCALSATAGAFTAVVAPLDAAIAALAVFGAGGAEAAERCRGPGHLSAEICDALYLMDQPTLARRVRVEAREAPPH